MMARFSFVFFPIASLAEIIIFKIVTLSAERLFMLILKVSLFWYFVGSSVKMRQVLLRSTKALETDVPKEEQREVYDSFGL